MNLKPPAPVAAAAKSGLELRKQQSPSNRGGTSVGIARARDLAGRKELSISTIKRMRSFFARHEVDKKAEGFRKGEEGFPSKGRQAWDLWGGDAGKAWANKMFAAIRRKQGVAEMSDVNGLAGADIRRIDGKMGKISAISERGVKLRWENGESEAYRFDDEALAEDIEIDTDDGWVALGAILDEAATSDEGQSTSDLIAETRLLRRTMTLSEAEAKRKVKASEKALALAKKKKSEGGGKKKKKKEGGSGGKKHSPYKRLSSRGQSPEDVPKHGGKSDNFFGKEGLTTMPKKKKWDCKKQGKYVQVCTNVKTGEEKTITIDPGYKKSYNVAYNAATAAGDSNAAAAKKKQ